MAKKKTKNKPTPAENINATRKTYQTLSNLRENKSLWYKICVLVYDLQNIKTDKTCENRTLRTIDPLYISEPYFTSDEAAAIKAVQIHSDTTLEQAITANLETFLSKRAASGDYRPCGPHDMVPVYLSCFGIDKAEIEDEKFISRLKRSGLATA